MFESLIGLTKLLFFVFYDVNAGLDMCTLFITLNVFCVHV